MREIEKRLSFLGTPVFRGFSSQCFPCVTQEGQMVRLNQEMKIENGSVWYGVVNSGKKRLVPYMLEPRGNGF
jgi:inorganic pyrophosphatase/exopolyphosphatase